MSHTRHPSLLTTFLGYGRVSLVPYPLCPYSTTDPTRLCHRTTPRDSKIISPHSLAINILIFADNLNRNYLLHYYINHPSSQHNHLDKLLIVTIIFNSQHSTHKIMIQKVRAHNNIFGDDEANKLAKQGGNRDPIPITLTPFHLIGQYLLPPNTMAQFEILNNILKMNIILHKSPMHPSPSPMFSNGYITQTHNNHSPTFFGIQKPTSNFQSTRVLKFCYGIYMGNQCKQQTFNTLLSSLCTLCRLKQNDTVVPLALWLFID